MATDWKSLTLAQKADLNARRRAKYEANVELERERAKAKFQALTPTKKQERREKQRLACPKSYTLIKGSKEVSLTHPDTVKTLWRLEQKTLRRKAALEASALKIQEWREAGCPYPWPAFQDKMLTTELFLSLLLVLGRRCSQCGTSKCFDFSWRITRRDDFLNFLPFVRRELEQALKTPQNYEIFCLNCAFDLKLLTFAWIFSPYSPRNSLSKTGLFGSKYAKWESTMKWMYPPGEPALKARIDSGKIRSLQYKSRLSTGKFVDSFIRKNHYCGHVGSSPRDLSWHVAEQAGQAYGAAYPEEDVSFWGANNPDMDWLGGANLLSPEFRGKLIGKKT